MKYQTSSANSRTLTKCVGAFPSSLTTSVYRDTVPSVASRATRSLALAPSPDATPRLTILSNLKRRGLAPNSSYEFGLGFYASSIQEPAADGELAVAVADEVIEIEPPAPA